MTVQDKMLTAEERTRALLVAVSGGVKGIAAAKRLAASDAARERCIAELRVVLTRLLQTPALVGSLAGQYNLNDEFGISGCCICEAEWDFQTEMPFDVKTGSVVTPASWRHTSDCALVAAHKWKEKP